MRGMTVMLFTVSKIKWDNLLWRCGAVVQQDPIEGAPGPNAHKLAPFRIISTLRTGALRYQGSGSAHATHFLIIREAYLIFLKYILFVN
jgi:hypothetical protein